MTQSIQSLQRLFPKASSAFLSVKPDGFLFQGQALPDLSVFIEGFHLVRKRFDDHRHLICFSPDGCFAKDGSLCDQCTESSCLSRIRLSLQPSQHDLPAPLLLELAFSSAANFLRYAEHLLANDIVISQTLTRLSVVPRGSWGEVLFHTAS